MWLGCRGEGEKTRGGKEKGERKEGRKEGRWVAPCNFLRSPNYSPKGKKGDLSTLFLFPVHFFLFLWGGKCLLVSGAEKGKILPACQSLCLDADITRLLERRRKTRKKVSSSLFDKLRACDHSEKKKREKSPQAAGRCILGELKESPRFSFPCCLKTFLGGEAMMLCTARWKKLFSVKYFLWLELFRKKKCLARVAKKSDTYTIVKILSGKPVAGLCGYKRLQFFLLRFFENIFCPEETKLFLVDAFPPAASCPH